MKARQAAVVPMIGSFLCALCWAPSIFALGQTRYVEFAATPGSVRLASNGTAAPIVVDSQDYPGVLRAARDLQTDIDRVSRIRPAIITERPEQAAELIIVGTLGKNRLIGELLRAGKLDAAAIRGRWESFVIQVVPQPWPGVRRALVIVGSDKRGTIYGLYDLSEQIGVSPWYWWADVPVTHHDQLFIRTGRYLQDEPAVKYRGIFLNDEAPALTGWVREKFGNYNHQFYEKVFELLLRLKANYLWPAMWNNAFNDDDPLNPKLADEYGIVMGTSHHEPMMRAQQEWKRYGKGAWDYAVNDEVLRAFWTEGVRRNREYENPTAEERKRSGGAGVYYHFDYVGGPRSYKWLNTVPITKIQEQMNLAYRYGANRIWIVNVGDLKPMEFPTEFFLNFAWNPERWPAQRLDDYTEQWAEREFGPEHAAAIAEIIAKYTKYNGRRKPELLEPTTYSLVNYREADTVLADYQRLAKQAEEIYNALPAEKKDACFQLVLYPVKASAVLNELYITVGKNRLYAVQGRASTNDLAERARELFRADEQLARYYNETMSGGKWNHLMDQTHIGYTFWNQPVRNAMPAIQEIQVPAPSEMGVSVEGSPASWPDGPGQPTLPPQNVYDRQPRYFEIFNRGQTPFMFTAEASEPWLRVSATHGTVTREQRVWINVQWGDVPPGATSGSISIAGTGDRKIVMTVPIVNPAVPRPDELEGFVETDGCVSIEAEHFTRVVETKAVQWKQIPDFGRTLSAMTTFPVAAPSQILSSAAARLEYRMYLFHDGPVGVDVYVAPTQNFQPGTGFRYGISFDDEKPQVINVHADYSQVEWERSVKDGVRVLTSKHVIGQPGYHVLKLWAIDPGLVIEKLVVNTGGVRPSYLGPPESFRREPRS